MITQFHVQNYKALRDVTVDLTPMHLLIGPNDSGKTSILEAITALCRSVDHRLDQAFMGRWSGLDLVWNRHPGGKVTLSVTFALGAERFRYELACGFALKQGQTMADHEIVVEESGDNPIALFHSGDRSGVFQLIERRGRGGNADQHRLANKVHRALSGVHYYRWNTAFLALPTAPDANRRFSMDPSGFGLALVLDDLLGYDRDRFIEMEKRFRSIFPEVNSIKLISESAFRSPADNPAQIPNLQKADGKGIHFEFSGGQVLPASQVSDGVLLVLAYLAVLYLPQPPRLILVEEPENGIHPRRLRDVLNILRELIADQDQTQIVLTTHSPYVVDLFDPEEVTLCYKADDGSVRTRRLSESPTVREQVDLFTLGEIWTGEGDEALVGGVEREGESVQ